MHGTEGQVGEVRSRCHRGVYGCFGGGSGVSLECGSGGTTSRRDFLFVDEVTLFLRFVFVFWVCRLITNCNYYAVGQITLT